LAENAAVIAVTAYALADALTPAPLALIEFILLLCIKTAGVRGKGHSRFYLLAHTIINRRRADAVHVASRRSVKTECVDCVLIRNAQTQDSTESP